ncbi:MAG: hypothetical protein A2017_16825 [Lentisphaerae bacterium GWF2_44_16]|nr:MAG: hypothetical protein A2017_16825 [Lentisphaerae bacterium GWF2_44_16]
MNISVICIGDELLKGATVNTNLAFIGNELLSIGIIPFNSMTVPDEKNALTGALDYLTPLSDVIITVGGLGPTADDITKNVIAGYFKRCFRKDEKAAENIIDRWNRFGRRVASETLMSQALVPEGAEVIYNKVGTAPGIWMETEKDKLLIMLPGPPVELKPMVSDFVVPRLKEKLKVKLHTELFHVVGLPESLVEGKMLPVISEMKDLSVAYCASPGEVRVFLTSLNKDTIEKMSAEMKRIFPENILLSAHNSLVEEISQLLRKNKLTAATAESCTGGMIAAAITELPGSSDIFKGSIVAYSNEVKENILGVRHETLEKYGAVSSECASEMLDNVCDKSNTETGIAVTGIAGPGGGGQKPVGLVYIAVRFKDRKIVREYNFLGNREMIRQRTVSMAFNLFRSLILNYSI